MSASRQCVTGARGSFSDDHGEGFWICGYQEVGMAVLLNERARRVGSLLLLTLLHTGSARASATPLLSQTCEPSATVDGPADLALELTRALVERKIRVEPSSLPASGGCERLTVELAGGADGIDLFIADPFGRTARRTVQSMETGAALVESWMRLELVEGSGVA